MKSSISLNTFACFIILILFSKVTYSQNKNGETPAKLALPASYYKGQEEKTKYVETQKANSTKTMTLSTFYPQKIEKQETANPEVMAKKMLNTPSVPADFPSYNSNSDTEKEYESRVAAWFKANPSFLKINK